MYVRCADCLASTWVDVIGPDGVTKSVDCGACGRRHVVQPNERLGTTIRSHYDRARTFSAEFDLDLPTGYAVLLGIMSMQQAEVLRHSFVASRQGKVEVPAPETREAAPAVEEVEEVEGVEEELPAPPVHRARRKVRAAASRPPRKSWLALAALGLGGVVWFLVPDGEAPAPPAVRAEPARHTSPPQPAPRPATAARPFDATRVRTDDLGRVVAVSGIDPERVLLAYCKASPLALVPIEIATPGAGDSRFGIFHDSSQDGAAFAIRIRQDVATKRWFAENDGRPLQVLPAPELPADAERVLVVAR